MAYVTPVVSFSPTYNGTFTTIEGIQSISINRGRQFFQDNFAASSCNIEVIPEDAGGTLAAMPVVGQWLEVRANTGGIGNAYFNGRVTGVNRSYGFPYNSTSKAAPADRVTITAAGPTGMLRTSNGKQFTIASKFPTMTAIAYVCSLIDFDAAQLGSNTLSYITERLYSNYQAFDLINQFARTGQIFIDDYDSTRTISPRILMVTNQLTTGSATFTDTGTTGSNIYSFNQIQYQSSARSAFSQVAVATPGLDTQTAQTGLGPYLTLNYSTYNDTTTSAASLAAYLLALNSQTTPVPFNISSSTLHSPDVMKVAELYKSGRAACALGTQITVEFRGVTANGQLQGIQSNFYPDHATISMFISPSLGTPFILDSATFGILDTNKLGFP